MPKRRERPVIDWAANLSGLDSQKMAVIILANLAGYKQQSKHAAGDVQRLATILRAINELQQASRQSSEIDAILDRLGRDIPVALDHMKQIVERLREKTPTPPSTEV